MDLAALPGSSASPANGTGTDPIVLNEWTARELAAVPGDRVELDYYLWDSVAGLQTRSAAFTVSSVVPIAGMAADRRLVPEYPGITGAENLSDWDPPFPIDLSRVRPVDEAYWRQFRTTPKVFVPYERGRDLWRSRYGELTSLRLFLGDGSKADESLASFSRALRSEVPASAMNVIDQPRADASRCRRQPVRRTSASTSPTSASSLSFRRCCSSFCSSSLESSSVCGRSASSGRPASRWRHPPADARRGRHSRARGRRAGRTGCRCCMPG